MSAGAALMNGHSGRSSGAFPLAKASSQPTSVPCRRRRRAISRGVPTSNSPASTAATSPRRASAASLRVVCVGERRPATDPSCAYWVHVSRHHARRTPRAPAVRQEDYTTRPLDTRWPLLSRRRSGDNLGQRTEGTLGGEIYHGGINAPVAVPARPRLRDRTP